MKFKIPVTLQTKSLSFVFALALISFLAIGGCSENNGGNGVDTPGTGASCTGVSSPCSSAFQNQEGTISECTSLISSQCAVDLKAVLGQLAPFSQKQLTNDTVMWIEAWGGAGGSSDAGTNGGREGYAVTTTTINDVMSNNNGSSVLYYFLGSAGTGGGKHCGSNGGGGTIVTTEDLSLNPSSNPTQTVPPVLLNAGGGGGGSGANQKGLCTANTNIFGGQGGVAIATTSEDGQGAGEATFNGDDPVSKGGNPNGMGDGGASGCLACNSNNNESSGDNGFGGLGGRGGSGAGCGGPQQNNYINLPAGISFSFTDGMGGNGSFVQLTCVAGGGGGGGGYGGGGGGSQGNEPNSGVAGAGGGSFAIKSTKSSVLAPTTFQANPCGSNNGCVRITFAP